MSGEAFSSPSAAKSAAKSFKAKAEKWNYEVYADKGGKARWRALSPSNGQNVGSGGQAFATASNARRAAADIRDNGPEAEGRSG